MREIIKMNKKGFTLIELLVVVLIIGILAAIALPKYKKTVEKTKLSEALMNIKTIEDALNIEMLLGKDTPSPLNELDINLPGAGEVVYTTQNFSYYVTGIPLSLNGFWAIDVSRNNNSYTLNTRIKLQADGQLATVRNCFTNNTEMGQYICHSLESQNWTYQDSTATGS